MLKTKIFLSLLLSWGGLIVNAQLTPSPSDRISHHIGLQINPLIEQVISLGSSPEVNNPFLLKYSLRFNETKKELMFGLGYRYTQNTAKNGLKSDLSDLAFRAGYSKKMAVGKRVEFGLGADLILKARNNQTVNVQVIDFGGGAGDSTITTSKSTVNGYGLGPQVTLSYYLTDRIMIGTEATFYFIRSKEKLEVQAKNYRIAFPGSPEIETINTDKDESKSLDFTLNLPVALFLIIVL